MFGREGNDWLETGRGNDVLQGDLGNDLLQGHSGGDSYVFGRGDGQAVIADVETRSADAIDRIRFEAGISPSDIVVLSVGPTDLAIGIDGGDDRLTIRNMFGDAGLDGRIEQFVFATGETWDFTEILARAGSGTAADERIDFGTEVALDATLAGGGGNDALLGGRGDTTYLFNPGDGDDQVIEADNWAHSSDLVRFGAGFDVADLVAVQQGHALLLRFKGHADTNPFGDTFFALGTRGTGVVDVFDFFVPTVDAGAALTTVIGFETGDLGDKLDIRLATGLQGTVVARQEGADTYVYFAHEGVYSPDSARQLIRLREVTLTELTSGNFKGAPFDSAAPLALTSDETGETLTGGWGDDTLIGSEGNDVLQGDNQNDTYRFEVGFGQDVVSESGWSNNSTDDVIKFGPGIAPEDLEVIGTETDLILKIRGLSDQIRIDRTLTDADYRVESVRFDDGTVLTHAQLAALAWLPTNADQTLLGDSDANTLDGGAGADVLTGGTAAEILVGGRGNDALDGAGGSDVYRFSAGFGQDVLSDSGENSGDGSGNVDVVEFDATIAPGDVIVERSAPSGGDLILIVAGSADVDPATGGIDLVRFSDGTSWDLAALLARAVPAGTSGQVIDATEAVTFWKAMTAKIFLSVDRAMTSCEGRAATTR